MLSELEESVLKAIMLGKKRVDRIARAVGIPSILAEKIVERLVEKGYLDFDLQPTEKAFRELKWLDRKHLSCYVGVLRTLIDIAIVISALALLLALFYFFGII
ncbi:MAG TPA: hypothetical protein EYP35_04645 [Desulfobacterales bacterium]|nr:hypothetical protein [Desulfobacterales bacterium]